jgi:hypothetical protein
VFRHIVRPAEDDVLPFRTAVIRPREGVVLAANVVTLAGGGGHAVEWDWQRAANAVGLKRAKDHIQLSANKELYIRELMEAAIPQSELMYNGAGAMSGQKAHCMNSSAFMLLLLLLSSTRQLAASAKQKHCALPLVYCS